MQELTVKEFIEIMTFAPDCAPVAIILDEDYANKKRRFSFYL